MFNDFIHVHIIYYEDDNFLFMSYVAYIILQLLESDSFKC